MGQCQNVLQTLNRFMLLLWWCPLGHSKGQLPAKEYIRMDRLIPILTHLSFHWTVPLKGHQLLYVLIFYFWSWTFDKSSKFWAALCKNESNLLLVRITVCIESCLPIGWRTFIWWKIHQSAAIFWFRLRNDGIFYLRAAIQRTVDISPAFFGARFGEKDRGLSTCKLRIKQAGGLMAFLHEAAQTFEVVFTLILAVRAGKKLPNV